MRQNTLHKVDTYGSTFGRSGTRLRLLRQQAGLTDTKLIALTGYGQDADRQRSQESGFDYHLVKPVDSGTLQELLERLMKRDSK